VSEIGALKRNAREDKGNSLLRPMKAASKAVRAAAKKSSNGSREKTRS